MDGIPIFQSLRVTLGTLPQESETISKQYYDDDSECGDAKYGMANEMDV